MEYVYATLILHETGSEINEANLTDVLESAGAAVDTSRVKAIVAALEDVDLAATQAAMMESKPDGQVIEMEAGADDDAADPGALDDEDGEDDGDDESRSGSISGLFGSGSESADEDDEGDEEIEGDEEAIDSQADTDMAADLGDEEVDSADDEPEA